MGVTVNIEPGTLVRIRTADPKGLVAIGPLLRVAAIEAPTGHLILDVESVTLSTIEVPHARPQV